MTCDSNLVSIISRHPCVWIFLMVTLRSVMAKMSFPHIGVSYRQHESGTEFPTLPSRVCFQSVNPRVKPYAPQQEKSPENQINPFKPYSWLNDKKYLSS